MDLMKLSYKESKEIVEDLKMKYPTGTTVALVKMEDPWSRIPIGTEGIVIDIDDIGTIHVSWSNGSSLGVLYGVDEVRIVKEATK